VEASDDDAGERTTSRLAPLLPALGLTLLNALKPLHVDDTAYFYVARQIARAPLRPYDFTAFWGDAPVPGNEVLAPAGLPLWWAIAIRAFGIHPLAWKLWLLPLAVLLAFSLHDLLRRFARGYETPLLWGTLFSPVVLPGFNLMLDVPALALGLGAFTLFLHACDRSSTARALLAGALLAWAAQTKYSAILVGPTIALAGLARGQKARAAIALATALVLFVGWETLVAVQHGASHFLLHARNLHGAETRGAQLHLLLPLVTLLGGVGSATTMVGLASLGAPRSAVAVVAALWLAGLLCFAAWPGAPVLFYSESPFLRRPFGPAHAVFVVLGATALLVWLWSCLGLLSSHRAGPTGREARARRDDWLVVGWLAIEATGAILLSPYAAVRRLLGPVVAATVVVARAARVQRRAPRRRLVVAAAICSAAVGCGVYTTDLLEAGAVAQAVKRASARIGELDGRPHPRVWFAGHWGLQFHAEEAGMRAVAPGTSALAPGDWLVVPDAHIHRQAFAVDASWATLVDEILVDDPWPWTTLSTYYAGISPVEGRSGARLRLALYRVVRAVVPTP
jgi:hypothetical protein